MMKVKAARSGFDYTIWLTSLALIIVVGLAACADKDDTRASPEATQGTQSIETQTPPAEPKTLPAPADVAAVPDDAQRSDSGLAWRVLVPGSGIEHPTPTGIVEVHYSGWTSDGTMFDSSRVGGETATFPLNRVIAGWTEGVQLMVAGEQRRFWIPPELAYKNSSRPGAPQGMLVFDIELIAIKD